MEISELERLAALVRRHNISELTLRQGEARVTLRAPALEAEAFGDEEPYDDGEAVTDERSDAASSAAPGQVTVTAPLVGVFHHIKPVVGLATRVTAGQVMGVIEAMRLVNEVTSPANGVVTDVVIEEGAAVEFGQPLFVVETE